MSDFRFRCPICKAPIARSAEDFPFCSERCRKIDLGSWADGSYAIPGEPTVLPDDENDTGSYLH